MDYVGGGHSGVAWKAWREDRQFVVKISDFSHEPPNSPSFLKALTETRCISACNHFAILKYVESHVEGSVVFLVTDICDALSLRRQLRLFVEDDIKSIFVSLTLALHHIHSLRMLHRDIKADNVFACSNGLVKLGDFGFSKKFDDTLVNGDAVAKTLLGTREYSAPEIFNGEAYGAKADVWSLGILLYELMTGSLPFKSDSYDGLHAKVKEGRYAPPPPERCFSGQLLDLLQHLLIVDPNRRFSVIDILLHPWVREGCKVLRMQAAKFGEVGRAIQQTIDQQRAQVDAIAARMTHTDGNHQNGSGQLWGAHHEGPVWKLKFEQETSSWSAIPRYLGLHDGHITIAMNQHHYRTIMQQNSAASPASTGAILLDLMDSTPVLQQQNHSSVSAVPPPAAVSSPQGQPQANPISPHSSDTQPVMYVQCVVPLPQQSIPGYTNIFSVVMPQEYNWYVCQTPAEVTAWAQAINDQRQFVFGPTSQ